MSTHQELWLSFNSNGSICSTATEHPQTQKDSWGNDWVQMTPTKNYKELLDVALAMRDYIDDIPDKAAASFPVMSGFDRDWADGVIQINQESAQ